MKLVCGLFFLAAVLSSNDLVGILPLGGGNFRVGLLPLAMLVGAALLSLRASAIPKPYYGPLLTLWVIANSLFVVNGSESFRTYAYAVWLILFASFVFGVGLLFNDRDLAIRLVRINMTAFAIIAAFGLLQFFLFAVGVNILVVQEWTSGVARINGLSYEPSYFATYMIVGWTVSLVLLLNRINVWSPVIDRFVFTLMSLVMVLCSSRMGYLGMLAVLVAQLPAITKLLGHSLVAFVITTFIVGGLALSAVVLLTNSENAPWWLLEGTGLAGTSAHSVDERLMGMEDYWHVFNENPLVGYSLGGVAAKLFGAGADDAISNEDLREVQGVNVSMEIVLATGVVFAPLFFLYLWKLTFGIGCWLSQCADKELRVATLANATALAAQFFLLQFNQNILRTYFWIQVAVVAALAGVLVRQVSTAHRIDQRTAIEE